MIKSICAKALLIASVPAVYLIIEAAPRYIR